MLKLFRQKNVTKMVLWALLILILPAFVLWGTGNLGRDGSDGPTCAGTIDGRKVSFEDFYKSLQHVRSQVILNYYDQPKTLDAFLANKELMGKLAWDRLLMEKEAKRHGIAVSDAEVIGFIKSHPIFARKGVFDDRFYVYILKQSMSLDPRSFEEIVRRNLEIRKLNDLIVKDVTVSDKEVLDAYRKDNEKFALEAVVISSDDLLDKTAIDDKQARDFYDTHKSEFAYTVTDKDAPGTPSGEAAKKTGFDDVKESIKTYLASMQAYRLALERAQQEYSAIKDLISKGATGFEAAATSRGLKIRQIPLFAATDYLDGIGEASELADAAVRLEPGEISEPVAARKGAVIFRIVDVTPYDKERFEKEKADFSKKVLADKKTALLEEWLRALERANEPNIDFKDYEKHLN